MPPIGPLFRVQDLQVLNPFLDWDVIQRRETDPSRGEKRREEIDRLAQDMLGTAYTSFITGRNRDTAWSWASVFPQVSDIQHTPNHFWLEHHMFPLAQDKLLQG